jgi:hypothetical protein
MSKPVVEVQILGLAATSGVCAVFLGNEEKVFVIYVEQSVGSGDRAVQARHAKGATAHFRTRKSRDHWKRQLGKTVELGDRSQEG